MASNPTMEAFERALAYTLSKETEQHRSPPAPDNATSAAQRPQSPRENLVTFPSPRQQSPKPAQQQQLSRTQPFAFAGTLPAIQHPELDFFSDRRVADLYLSPAVFVPQPCPDIIRPWDHILVGTNNTNEVYKRAGIASSRVPAKRITDDATTEHELFAAQMGPRKMVRTCLRQPQLGAKQQLFDPRAMLHFGPEMAALDIMIARDGISRHHGWLARNNLEYPLDIKNHTWTGSLEYEVMTILPRKRYSNREFKIRLEERIYGEVHGGVPDDRTARVRKIAPIRRRQTLAKCPDLSTISERSEPPSSPVRPRTGLAPLNASPTKLAPLDSSPAKLLLGSHIELTPRNSLSPRKAFSPFEFEFSSPSPANGSSASTPAKNLSLIKSAAMWRTPDIFASTPKVVALSGSPPRSAPFSPSTIFDNTAVDCSPAKSRRSSTGFSHRGSRQSLTTSRLLAISELAQSPALPKVSFSPSDQTAPLPQGSVADITMTSAAPLEESAVGPTLSPAADSMQAASNLVESPLATHDREFVAPADAEADFVVPANAEASFATPANAEAGFAAPAIAEASFAEPASDHDDETKRIDATSEQASIHVDLRTNLDIFGARRDVPASMTQVDDVDMVEEATPPPEKQANMDEDGADDGVTSVINHSNINDTISLNLGVAQPSSGQPTVGNAGEGEDSDEDREELQQFLNRHWGQAKGAAKPKRRSGSLGLATSVTGSPMPRSEVAADNETMGKRRPLGIKDPNMSPSPAKKRKAADSDDDEPSGGRSLLEAPALDDHSPPRPKRRRRNVEADSDGVLNPAFQQQAAQGEPRELRRSTRASARRNLVTAGPSANSTAMSKVPVKLPGSLVGDGADSSFGSSLSAARTEERRLAATTRANTRKNRAGALPAGELLALKAKQKTPPAGEGSGDEGPRAKKRAKAGMTKSVRWDSVLARYQDEALASSDAAGGPRAQPTPVRKTSAAVAAPSGPPPPGITVSRVKKPAARTTAVAGTPVARRSSAQLAAASAKMAALVSPPSAPSPAAATAIPVAARRTSAQLAAASAAKKMAAAAAASVAVPVARRTRIATPAPKKQATRA